MKKYLATLLLTISSFHSLNAFADSAIQVNSSNPNVPTVYKEFCLLQGGQCMVGAFAVDVRNPSYDKFSKIVLFTTNPSVNSQAMKSTIQNDFGMGKSVHKVEVRLLSAAQYDTLKFQNDVETKLYDLNQDIHLAERDLNTAYLNCGLGVLICGGGMTAAIVTLNPIAVVVALGTCTNMLVQCTSISTKIDRLKILRSRLERIMKNNQSSGGPAGGVNSNPAPGSDAPPPPVDSRVMPGSGLGKTPWTRIKDIPNFER